LTKDDEILLIYGTNIPDAADHQMIAQVSTSFNVCFCTIWERQNKRNIALLSMAVLLLD